MYLFPFPSVAAHGGQGGVAVIENSHSCLAYNGVEVIGYYRTLGKALY